MEKQQNPNEPLDLTKENKKKESVIIRFKRSSEGLVKNYETQSKKPKIVTAESENNIEVIDIE